MIAVQLLLLLSATLGAQSVTSKIDHDSEASGGSGGDAKLRCVYKGSKTARQIIWEKETNQERVYIASRHDDKSHVSDVTLQERLTFLGQGNNDATILIRALRVSDSGTYICKFMTMTGLLEAKINLIVVDKPEVTVSGVTGPMQEGSTKVTLSCRADANPSAKYSWMRNGTHMNGSDHSTLTLDRAVSNSGMYRCIAVNYMGSDAGEIEVNITYAPAQPTTVPTTTPLSGTGLRVSDGPGSLVWI
uniref:Ig-like domain-containing protein n=1 Tax=Petromyzon marinus TaxID=7757 RepID=S4RY11_PETMA